MEIAPCSTPGATHGTKTCNSTNGRETTREASERGRETEKEVDKKGRIMRHEGRTVGLYDKPRARRSRVDHSKYSRCAEREAEIGGYVLPAKAYVAVCPYALHRHPEFWPHPERFDPDRLPPESALRPAIPIAICRSGRDRGPASARDWQCSKPSWCLRR